MKQLSVKKWVTAGALAAIAIVLSYVGVIPLPWAKVTTATIPVIVAGVLLGPVVGGLVGLAFGVFSMIQNMQGASWLSPALMNPLVSVLPRILIGVVAYYVYNGLRRGGSTLAIGAAAAAATLTNTIGVLGMSYLLFLSGVFLPSKNNTSLLFLRMIFTVVTTNGLIEMATGVIICIPVIRALQRLQAKDLL